MERLSGLDASFVYNETASLHMHTLKYSILDVRGVEGGFTVDRLRDELGRRVDLPWIVDVEEYNPRWIAHRFDVRSPADLDHPELPALLCESYRDNGDRGSLRR